MLNKVLQFEGDIRMWAIAADGTETPVLADDDDIYGNVPIEANAAIFQYEAGELVEVKSKRRDRYNQTIHSDQLPGTSTLSLTLVAVPPAIMARVFFGDSAESTVTGAPVAAENITFGADALQQALAHDHLATTPAPVVTDATDTTTYVAGTDYVIDSTLGRIRRLSTGSIGATDTVHVAYTYKSYTLTSIEGGAAPQQKFRLHGNFLNRPDEQDMFLDVWEANLSTDGDVDLLSGEPITVTLTGPLITPDDKTSPYQVKLFEV